MAGREVQIDFKLSTQPARAGPGPCACARQSGASSRTRPRRAASLDGSKRSCASRKDLGRQDREYGLIGSGFGKAPGMIDVVAGTFKIPSLCKSLAKVLAQEVATRMC